MNDISTRVTQEIAAFASKIQFRSYPSEAVRIGKRCILDGLGLILAGSKQKCTEIVRRFGLHYSQAAESTVYGKNPAKTGTIFAALVNGTAGHAMDWDDTQLSSAPDRVFGLLTHPTIPPLSACLALSEKLGGVSGREFLNAFLAGFEVECKIAEAINPDHYSKGFHSSGTIGVFAACIAAGKLLGLDEKRLRHAIGISSSMSAGIRVNFGTMVKPLHVGRASENGVTAAILAADGFEANPDALDGQWGYFQVIGGGFDIKRISGVLGNPYSIITPGVSIKPYPCGVLTHPSMDAMLELVVENDVKPEDIKEGVLYAASNILNPIRYTVAHNELEAKFCMPFLLSAIALSRKAGVKEFTDAYVNSQQVQGMMKRFRTEQDPEIEAKGYQKILSRVELRLRDGLKLVKQAQEAYRGGPANPLSDEALRAKFTDCTEDIIALDSRQRIFDIVYSLEKLRDMEKLFALLRASE